MEKTFIYQHLGLGDHIVCNGLVRELSKQFEHTVMLVKEHNFHSVKAMFSDLKMDYVVGKDDTALSQFITEYKPNPLYKIGHDKIDLSKNFDRSFYEESGIDFEKRWSSWHIPRNLDNENKVSEYLKEQHNVIDNNYIFIHDDERFPINMNLVENSEKYPIIRPIKGLTPSVFDYLILMENAKKIHCIASTFMFIIDSIDTCDNIYVHRYMRGGPSWCEPTLKKNWGVFK